MRFLLALILAIPAYSQNAHALLVALEDSPNAPTDSPGGGTYSSTQSVTLTDATSQFINYTTNGSTPACPATGTLYTGAFNITVTTTLKAIGCNGVTGGGVLTSIYTITAGGPTRVHLTAGCDSVGGSTYALTIPATTNGNVLAVVMYNEGSSATNPTVAAAGTTFVLAEPELKYFGGARTLMLYTAVSIPASVTTVTATWNVSTTGCIAVGEYSGVTTLDAKSTGGGNLTLANSPFTGAVPATAVTAGKNEIMFGGVFDSSGPDHTGGFGGTGTWTVGITAYENGGSFGSFAYYENLVASTSGTYAITGTQSGTATSQAITSIASFF